VGWRSIAEKPSQRWAVDATHLVCGRDGWCHMTAIIDCCDRTIAGWRLSKTGVARHPQRHGDALRGRQIKLGKTSLRLKRQRLVFGAKPSSRR